MKTLNGSLLVLSFFLGANALAFSGTPKTIKFLPDPALSPVTAHLDELEFHHFKGKCSSFDYDGNVSLRYGTQSYKLVKVYLSSSSASACPSVVDPIDALDRGMRLIFQHEGFPNLQLALDTPSLKEGTFKMQLYINSSQAPQPPVPGQTVRFYK